ncbi:primosomal protein N' [Betaproteobacteria bacterium]|nr:primosomal protein N' [Betaproteobacteria bacterium]GHU02781.1 primosomal protein N' [Betaproteobacteria bacterium]GHU18475.1 primosomal protein N' [Betaproteobacteria bacterium]
MPIAPVVPIVQVALPLPLPQLFDYVCADATAADVGRTVRVPFGRGEKTGLIFALAAHSAIAPAQLKSVTHLQRETPALPPDWLALVSFTARYYHAAIGEVVALALPPGLRRAEASDGHDHDPLLELTAAGREALAAARRNSRALELLRALATSPPLRRSALRALPAGQAVGEALRRGWLGSVDGPRQPHLGGALPALTAEQTAVLDRFNAAQGFGVWLLAGVTGSGKTEVYLRLAAAALAAGRQVLMLVPEIALTPQLEARVEARFPAARIVSLHSALAEGARTRGFVSALSGDADIILGTRLAVFTPLPRPGLILVDEEHDASYKQQEGIRYSARDLAIWRARAHDIPVVLGSATPSLESWRHAQSGHYHLLRLKARAVATTLPTVRTVDTRKKPLDEGISPDLQRALAERLARGEQSLVFLNRRGYAPVLACAACGWVSRCPHCSANSVVHLADRQLRCHHCGSASAIPRACPQCGNQDILPFGRGTQRVEARLIELFPTARVLRIDRDAARTRRQWEALLARIAAGEADILVGTQMMAKGHDFPRLTLVGVVGADASLHAADFRAPERLFQQLMQVGGRAGRAELPGEVLIQTEYPEHPLYRHLVRQDFDAFAHSELTERHAAAFPPFSHQAMLRADAPDLSLALDFLHSAKQLAAASASPAIRLADPVPMRLTRLARRERAQLLLEADQRGALQDFLARWLEALRAQRTHHELRWHIDIDPLEV